MPSSPRPQPGSSTRSRASTGSSMMSPQSLPAPSSGSEAASWSLAADAKNHHITQPYEAHLRPAGNRQRHTPCESGKLIPLGKAEEVTMEITLAGLIVALIIGAIAGWLAGQIVKGSGFGLWGNIIVGIIGAVVASLLFPAIGINLGGGIIGSIIAA